MLLQGTHGLPATEGTAIPTPPGDQPAPRASGPGEQERQTGGPCVPRAAEALLPASRGGVTANTAVLVWWVSNCWNCISAAQEIRACPSGSCPVDGRTVLQGALAPCPSSGEHVAPGAVLIAEQMAHTAHLLCEGCCSLLQSVGLSDSCGLMSSVGPEPSPGTQWAGSISATNRQGCRQGL